MISVVIPTYNRASIINRAISSVQNQTYQKFEIIIVDDASTDNTQEVVCSINDNRITYYKLDINSGGATARNKGIELSGGDFIAFLDSDDEWYPTMLETCLNKYQNIREKNAIIFSKLLMDNKTEKKVFPKSIYNGEDLSEYIFCKKGLVHTITLFLPVRVAQKVKFREGLIKHQDYDFVLRAYNSGIAFYMINEVLAIWHCESRKDRMGVRSEYEYSYRWLQENAHLFTESAYKAFVERDIVKQIKKRKWSLSAISFLFHLKFKGLIRNNVFIKSFIKIFIPK